MGLGLVTGAAGAFLSGARARARIGGELRAAAASAREVTSGLHMLSREVIRGLAVAGEGVLTALKAVGVLLVPAAQAISLRAFTTIAGPGTYFTSGRNLEEQLVRMVVWLIVVLTATVGLVVGLGVGLTALWHTVG